MVNSGNDYYKKLDPDFRLRERYLAEDRRLESRYRRKAAEICKHITPHLDLERATILDLGCGRGTYGRLLVGEKGRVVGVDLNLIELDIAGNASDSRFSYLAGNGCFLPFKASLFDLILCRHTLEHLSDPERFLREARRVLKPDGAVYLSTPNRFSFLLPNGKDGRKWLRKKFLGTDEGVYQMYTLRELRALVMATGFRSPLPLPIPGFPESLRGCFFQVVRPTLKVLLKPDPSKGG